MIELTEMILCEYGLLTYIIEVINIQRYYGWYTILAKAWTA